MNESFSWRILRVGSLRECLDAWQSSNLCQLLDDRMRTAVEITIDELGSNFLRYSGAKSKEMLLTVTFDGAVLTMKFDDDGELFDPTMVPEPPKGNIGLLPVGGRGIHMARRSMDSWEYQEVDKRNLNVLVKKVAVEVEPEPEQQPVILSTPEPAHEPEAIISPMSGALPPPLPPEAFDEEDRPGAA
ncbi:ATP-binding protein [Phragmitibacter flavus]|nr:ATP-binding protein [Phragmitibacter flavus]